jgi:2-dehydro-3-deoxyglucarate aldolase/4-hydroxy-2-oxoheptanedioate aldolase
MRFALVNTHVGKVVLIVRYERIRFFCIRSRRDLNKGLDQYGIANAVLVLMKWCAPIQGTSCRSQFDYVTGLNRARPGKQERAPQAEYAFVARVLDQGAQGIIVPRVNDAQTVRDIVSWMRYPPAGIRGFADTAPQTDHQRVPIYDFMESNNQETLCVIQIERRQALDNLDEMLAVPGVDVACMGCMDLSIDLGIPGQIDHPTMVAAIQQVVDAARRHGVASGIIIGQMETINRCVQAGMRFASYATESILMQDAAKAAVGRLRSAMK